MAWLQTVPRKPERKNIAAAGRGDERMTRAQRIAEEGGALQLPPVDAGGYLIDYLMDAGPVAHGAAGPVPLASLDLLAWRCMSGIVLAPWEASLLRRLSRDYAVEAARAEAPDCPPPWGGRLDVCSREKVARKVSLEFAARARQKARH